MLGIIMAGGQGTRLQPLTDTRPKPMVEVLGRPVIDFVKEAMLAAGITEIVVTTGYRGEQLGQHVDGWNDPANGIQARINQEAVPMGTAGSVGLLREHITDTCIVGSGDGIASFDIAALLQAHRDNGAKVTMALWEVEDPTEFGIVGLGSTPNGTVDSSLRSGFIRRFKEKPTVEEAFSNVINAGLYILEPEVFDHIPSGEKFDFSKQLFPKLLELDWPMYASTIDGVWFDVGLPSELLRAQTTLLTNGHELPYTLPETYVLRDGCLVSNTAAVAGRVSDSVVGKNVNLGLTSVLEGSLVMDGCVLDEGAVVIDSVLGRGVQVQANARLERCVVGDGASIGAGEILTDSKIR
ncbi:MAG: NDP-sugar synthase [archaeon]|nr:NDP-sugar synthase [archaeon]